MKKPKIKPVDYQDTLRQATKGSQFGAILACAYEWPLARGVPAFSGLASVTSDGFVLCNFRSANGEGHYGAFVGSFADLCHNAKACAAHCGLTPVQRAEYAAALCGWIDARQCSRPSAREALRHACLGNDHLPWL